MFNHDADLFLGFFLLLASLRLRHSDIFQRLQNPFENVRAKPSQAKQAPLCAFIRMPLSVTKRKASFIRSMLHDSLPRQLRFCRSFLILRTTELISTWRSRVLCKLKKWIALEMVEGAVVLAFAKDMTPRLLLHFLGNCFFLLSQKHPILPKKPFW